MLSNVSAAAVAAGATAVPVLAETYRRNHELVAADARHQVDVAACAALQPVGDRGQHEIADSSSQFLAPIIVVMQKGWPAGSISTRHRSGDGCTSAAIAPIAQACA